MSFSDIFKSSFLENVTSVSLLDMALVLVLSFALGLFIFFVYKKTYAGVMFSSSFGVTLVALTMISTLVIPRPGAHLHRGQLHGRTHDALRPVRVQRRVFPRRGAVSLAGLFPGGGQAHDPGVPSGPHGALHGQRRNGDALGARKEPLRRGHVAADPEGVPAAG